MRIVNFVLALVIAVGSAGAFEKITLREEWLKAPATYEAPADLQKADVRALFFEGAPYLGKPTRVFAYVGLPKNIEAGKKVPGMVLVHGGGGTAFDTWVRMWNERGYAAIAMDNVGAVPKRDEQKKWARHEFSGPLGQHDFQNALIKPEDQWTYHAISSVVLAHSLLRSLPEVDAERIGVTGVSWGGYLTCITSGVDTRFKFAAPVYGCGFLGDNSTWLKEFERIGPEKRAAWLKYWDPSVYLKDTTMPTLWLNGTNDFAYPLDSYQKSYRLVKGPRTLCVKVRMPHGHGKAGEGPEEILAFADSFFRGGKPLAKIVEQGSDKASAWAVFSSERPIETAEFNFTKDTGVWKDRKWETIPAQIDKEKNRVSAAIPEGATVFYMNIVDSTGMFVSTEQEERK